MSHRAVRRAQEMINYRELEPGALLPAQLSPALGRNLSRSVRHAAERIGISLQA